MKRLWNPWKNGKMGRYRKRIKNFKKSFVIFKKYDTILCAI